jgi:DNA-binding Lrp family transcriptional regulator
MLSMSSIDSLDAQLMLSLDDDPDASVLSLARTLGIARNTVHARLRRLALNGVVRAFSRRVDPVALGYPLTAFVFIAISQVHDEQAVAGLARIPEVIEVHSVTGDTDIFARVVARDPADLRRITGSILRIEGVVRTSTSLSMSEVMPLRLSALLASIRDSA